MLKIDLGFCSAQITKHSSSLTFLMSSVTLELVPSSLPCFSPPPIFLADNTWRFLAEKVHRFLKKALS